METKDITILVDLDDTLWNLVDGWCAYLHDTFDVPLYTIDDIEDWDMTLKYPMLSKDDVFSPLHNKHFWAKYVKPYPDAQLYLKKLYDEGFKIVVVTNSNYKLLEPKMDLLFECYPYLTYDDVIITKQKHLVLGDFLIDDCPDNLVNGKYHGILLNKRHNQNFNNLYHCVTRVYNWEQIYDWIHNITNPLTKIK